MNYPATFNLKLLTPLFSRGSYDATTADSAEIRAPSIRGQLHHWLRQLGYDAAMERAIFGAVQKDFGGKNIAPTASKVVIRVSSIQGAKGTPPTLPHKSGGNASPKPAYMPGTTFKLDVLHRLGGLSPEARSAFDRILEVWLLAGSLGLRSTRAGGSFHWDQSPADPDAYVRQLTHVIGKAPLRFALLQPVFKTPEDVRIIATDTISHQALADLRFPLGAVKQGFRDNSGAPSRKTSPMRLSVRKFADGYRLIVLWDERVSVTDNTIKDLSQAVDRLANGSQESKPKKLGAMLQGSTLFR